MYVYVPTSQVDLGVRLALAGWAMYLVCIGDADFRCLRLLARIVNAMRIPPGPGHASVGRAAAAVSAAAACGLLVPSGAFWGFLVPSVASWGHLLPAGAFLVLSGAFWGLLLPSGAFCGLLWPSEASWAHKVREGCQILIRTEHCARTLELLGL